MNKRLLALAVPVLGLLWFLAPKPSLAFTATLVSLTPDATDISDQIDLPENIAGFGFMGTMDQDYEAVFSVDEEPAMVVLPGGEMNLDQNWVYDSVGSRVIVNFTATGVKGDFGESFPEGSAVFIIALVPVAAEGEDGPPESMTGAWLSTNVMNWSLIPPSPEAPYFGFELTGPAGETGFLHMFIPATLIDLLSEYSGQDLSAESMAVFENNDQSSTSVTDVDGSAYIDINVTFSNNVTSPAGAAETEVVKEITAGAKLPISLAATKYAVTKGDKTRFYGWIKSGKAGKTVTLWRKLKGADEFVKIATLTTQADGYFSTKVVINKTATYKAKFKRNADATAKVSPVQKVRVQ